MQVNFSVTLQPVFGIVHCAEKQAYNQHFFDHIFKLYKTLKDCELNEGVGEHEEITPE